MDKYSELSDRQPPSNRLTAAEFGRGLAYIAEQYITPAPFPVAGVIGEVYGGNWVTRPHGQYDSGDLNDQIEATKRVARDSIIIISELTAPSSLARSGIITPEAADMAVDRVLRPGIRTTLDALHGRLQESSEYLAAVAQLPSTLLLAASARISRWHDWDSQSIGNLDQAWLMDDELTGLCARIVAGDDVRHDSRTVTTAMRTLAQAYTLSQSRDFAIDTIRRLAPYYIIRREPESIQDDDVLAAISQLQQECDAYGSPLDFTVTKKNSANLVRQVRRELIRLRNRSYTTPDQESVWRAYAGLSVTRMARFWVNGIADGTVKMNTLIALTETGEPERERLVGELRIAEVRVDAEEPWVQIGNTAGGSGEHGERQESDDERQLREIAEQYPHIDYTRLLWLQALRDTWPTPGAKLVRRPLNGREMTAAEEQGTVPEAQYRGYYVVLLPVVLPNGDVVYNAVGDALVRKRNALRGWKWQRGFKADGTQFAGPEHVFGGDKDNANEFGAKRFLHTSNVWRRVLEYLEADMEFADPTDELLAVAMGMLAVRQAEQIDGDELTG
jgi:hypothetical protein